MSRMVFVRAAVAARKMSRIRRVPAVVVEVVLDGADVRESERLGLLGQEERLGEVLARRRRPRARRMGKNCTPKSIASLLRSISR